MKCLETLGVTPTSNIVQNIIKKAIIYSPSGSSLEIDASRQRVVVLDRNRFDRELAKMAIKNNVELKVGKKVINYFENDEKVKIETKSESYTAKWVINATGYVSFPNKNNLLQAAKFEVNGDWFDRDRIEIYFDQKISPGYFTWVIPINSYTAKVGVAGRGVNQFKVLDEFVKTKGGVVIKKTAAQIVVGGPLKNFISGHIVSVGDAAGQSKPTTGGGIYSGGVGGMLAGKYIAESLSTKDNSLVNYYQETWNNLFSKEFNILLKGRNILERLSNDNIDKIFKYLASSNLFDKISEESDFDYHSIAILKALGLKNIFQITSILGGDILKTLKPLLRFSEETS
jgi:flavin-dependent dehydrogenase